MTVRVAYLVSRYPYVSHTFIAREVRALRARGVEVQTLTVRRPDPGDVVSELDREEARTTDALLPTTAGRLLRAHARAFLRGPGAYVRTLGETLRDASAGPRSTLWQLFYFAEAVLLWDRLRADDLRHVHVHHANVSADLALIATRLANRLDPGAGWTWSLTFHGPTELADVPGHKLALKTREADAVVAIGDFARSQLLALVEPERWEKIEVIHCGIDPAAYPATPGEPLSSSALRVLTVARLEARKGQEVLIEAVARLRGEGLDVELTVVGDGPARERAERAVERLGVAGAVRFAGAVDQRDVAGFYAAADVFCLPSFAEGVPVVLMEAMASGLPVVATQIMGIPELVQDGSTGRLVPPGRADALAAALRELAGAPDLVARLGAAARERVVADYAIGDSAAALERLFRRLRP
jgi:glycosyltransferase involved in cell wall biosynthesis